MAGITVLNTLEYLLSWTWYWSTVSTVMLILSILTISFAFAIGYHTSGNSGQPLVIIGGVLLALTLINAAHGQPKEIQTRYEVLIDENVTYQELTQKYDVIEQRGEIYVITEKEDE